MSASFLAHGKQKIKMKDACKKGHHEWLVSKWLVKGSHKTATEFYCKFCMLTMEAAEKDYQAKLSCCEQKDLEAQEQGI